MINNFHFKLHEGDTEVGYMHGSCDNQAGVLSANITQIRVHEGHQSKGHGTTLIRQFEQWCRENGISEVYAWIQSGDIERAKEFYEKNGFNIEESPFGDLEIFKEL